MKSSNGMQKQQKVTKKPADFRFHTEPDNFEQENNNSANLSYLNRSRNMPRISPNITPKSHLNKILGRPSPSPLTSRASKANILSDRDGPSFDESKIPRGSKSPNFGRNIRDTDRSTTEDSSDNFGKKLLDATHERKYLEEQYKLMENRVKHLMDENEKIKGKIKQTKVQTENIIKNRERFADREEKARQLQERREREALEKKNQIAKMKQEHEEKRKREQENLMNSKLRLVSEVRQQKMKDQEMKEEYKREEEIRRHERIWKIAIHEKELENSKMVKKIQTRDAAKKVYEHRVVNEEKRAADIEKKIQELEQLELKLVEDLKNTHNSHINAYAEMEKVSEIRLSSRYTSNSQISSNSNKSKSPFRAGRK